MEETIGAAELPDAAIGTGIAVDKMLALTGQLPVGILTRTFDCQRLKSVSKRAVHMVEKDRDNSMRALDAKLDACAAILKR